MHIGHDKGAKQFLCIIELDYREIKNNSGKKRFEAMIDAKLIMLGQTLKDHRKDFIKDAK